MTPVLTASERLLLERQLGRKRLALGLSIGSVAAALGLMAFWLAAGALSPCRLVLFVLILIGAKNHLRIYRLTGLLEKLSGGVVS